MSEPTYPFGKDKEIEADKFAAELLMPRKLLVRAMQENPHVTARELAVMFQVEEHVMTRRIAGLRFPSVGESPALPSSAGSGGKVQTAEPGPGALPQPGEVADSPQPEKGKR